MRQRAVLLAGAAVALLAVQAQANAAVVNMPQSLTLFIVPAIITMGTATFSFTLDTTSSVPATDVSTADTGAVSTILGGIADFEASAPIDRTGVFTFASDPTATMIPNSQADDFIGLSYMGNGGTYYGCGGVRQHVAGLCCPGCAQHGNHRRVADGHGSTGAYVGSFAGGWGASRWNARGRKRTTKRAA